MLLTWQAVDGLVFVLFCAVVITGVLYVALHEPRPPRVQPEPLTDGHRTSAAEREDGTGIVSCTCGVVAPFVPDFDAAQRLAAMHRRRHRLPASGSAA